MGLDMFAYSVPAALLGDAQVDFTEPKDEQATELAYWRKHPNLHGWMEKLYVSKGGSDKEFNCSNVRLMAEDLDTLEQAIKGGGLPHTEGFFFGASKASESERAQDLEFIANARAELAQGRAVYYTSWW